MNGPVYTCIKSEAHTNLIFTVHVCRKKVIGLSFPQPTSIVFTTCIAAMKERKIILLSNLFAYLQVLIISSTMCLGQICTVKGEFTCYDGVSLIVESTAEYLISMAL